jgi:trehalose-6-phosphate synthase
MNIIINCYIVSVITLIRQCHFLIGLVARLKALDRLFDEFPHWLGKVTFLQASILWYDYLVDMSYG